MNDSFININKCRLFNNIDKWFIKINKRFYIIDKSFININICYYLSVLENHWY